VPRKLRVRDVRRGPHRNRSVRGTKARLMEMDQRTPAQFVDALLLAHNEGDGIGERFDVVIGELAAAKKSGHWIWYVFLQVRGLGSSEMARKYWVHSHEDLLAVLENSVLRDNFRRAFLLTADALATGRAPDLPAIFGGDVVRKPDARKVVSSATLFAGHLDRFPQHDCADLRLAAYDICASAIARGAPPCSTTLRFLLDQY